MSAVRLLEGDCIASLKALPENSVDSVVTDPPYHLTAIVKRFGKSNMEQPADKDLSTVNAGAFRRLAGGFMGKSWDGGDIAFRAETWAEVLRVLKPGGHLVAFAGTRGAHRMVCAIEDAGFEVRDSLMWVYGTGFPKSHNVGDGWGTALKPAHEPICLARKPLSEKTVAANVLRWGTGAINIDGCRVEAECATGWGGKAAGGGTWTEENCGLSKDGAPRPAQGRWPANIVHDGSPEVLAGFPDTGASKSGAKQTAKRGTVALGDFAGTSAVVGYDEPAGSAARFFYSAKASEKDRAGSKHPTVKPIALMQWLCRLITPPGGVVLDPFAGSGTTGAAARAEGFGALLCEREAEYIADICRRMGLTSAADFEALI